VRYARISRIALFDGWLIGPFWVQRVEFHDSGLSYPSS
jgi:hypothetical protein